MFEGQRPEEKVIFILRKHPVVLFMPIFWLTLLTLLPVFAFIYFKFSWVFSYAFFFWLIFGGIYAFKTWFCFKNSQYILTSERLIFIDQKGIFYKTVSEAYLSKIQDVSFEIKGFWPSMFDFGTIYVQTAGAQEKIALECVDEPRKIQEQIIEASKGIGEKEEPKIKKEVKKIEEIKRVSKKDEFWD